MGWFEFLRQREQEKADAAARAVEAAKADWRSAAWANLSDRDFVETIYTEVSNAEPSVGWTWKRAKLALGGGPESARILLDQGAGDAAPWIAAQLFGDNAGQIARLLMQGLDLGRPIADRLEDERLVPFLAGSPHEADRDAAAAVLSEQPAPNRFHFANRLALCGDARADSFLTEVMTSIVEGRTEETIGDDEHALDALSRSCIARFDSPERSRWIEAWAKIAPTGGLWAMHALAGLGDGTDDAATDVLKRFVAARIDDRAETRVMRMAANLALAARGHEPLLDEPLLEDARWVRSDLHPERYSWPKSEDLVIVRRFVAECFLRGGTEEEKEWAAGFVTSPFWFLREVGDKACAALGRRPERIYFDAVRAEEVLAEEGPGGLFAALDDPRSVFLDVIVDALAKRADEDEALRDQLIAYARRRLESQPNFYVQYADDVPEDSKRAMRFLRGLDSEIQQEKLAGTTSAWIQTLLLEGAKMQRPQTPLAIPEGVSVRCFDSAPFVLGSHINGLDVSPDGTLLCAVGGECARIVDAHTGDVLRSLELRWNWGYDCAFHPSGTQVAASFHGGHVEIYDVATGQRTHEFIGHGGVPTGTRCLAWSPDGEVLVSGGGDGRLIAWDVETRNARWVIEGGPGSYQDVIFLSSQQILATHVKTTGGEKNFLQFIDVATGEDERVATDRSIWSLALRDDGLFAMAGDGKKIQVGRFRGTSFVEEQTFDHEKVVRLHFAGERLWSATETGKWAYVDLAENELTEVQSGGPLWGMCFHGERCFAVGTSGRIFVAEGTSLVEHGAGASHNKRLVGSVELASGELVTVDWDGIMIRWPTRGPGRLLAELGLTAESMVLLDETRVLVGSRKGLRLVDLESGDILAQTDERADDIAVQGDLVAHAADEHVAFKRLPSLAPAGIEPVHVGSDDIDSLCAAFGGFLAGTEKGEVGFITAEGALEWLKTDHGADRMRKGDPHRDVCSVVTSGSYFVSGATDHVVRVYNWNEGAADPVLRIATGFGLFNRLAVQGSRLAIPASYRLEVYDLETRSLVLELDHHAFDSNELMGAHYLRDGRLLLRTKAGRIFLVEDAR
ncbi:MAG: hypothetical protein AAGE52_04990 [Myxococcota bacterium]